MMAKRRKPVKMATKKPAASGGSATRSPGVRKGQSGRAQSPALVAGVERPPRRAVKMMEKKAPVGRPDQPAPWALPPEDREVQMPDGGFTTMRKLFPGLYGPPPVDVSPERLAARRDPATVTMHAADWPVPCPDALCCETDGMVIGGVVADPSTPGQRHHYLCQYWDKTGAHPFTVAGVDRGYRAGIE